MLHFYSKLARIVFTRFRAFLIALLLGYLIGNYRKSRCIVMFGHDFFKADMMHMVFVMENDTW